MAIHNLLGHPETLNLIKNVEDTFRSLETISLKKQKHGYLILS